MAEPPLFSFLLERSSIPRSMQFLPCWRVFQRFLISFQRPPPIALRRQDIVPCFERIGPALLRFGGGLEFDFRPVEIAAGQQAFAPAQPRARKRWTLANSFGDAFIIRAPTAKSI